MNYKDLQNISYLSHQILTEASSEEHNVMNRWPYASPYLQEERAPGVKPYKPGVKPMSYSEPKPPSGEKGDGSGYGADKKFTQDTDAKSFRPGVDVPKVKKFGRISRSIPHGIGDHANRTQSRVSTIVGKDPGAPKSEKMPPQEKKKPSREIIRKGKQEESFELWVNDLISEGYDLSEYTWDELYENYQQLNEISDRKVERLLKARDRQDRDSGGISAGFMARTRAHQAAARRNVRTGSNVKVDPDLAKESYDIYDVILSHLLDEGYAETVENAEAIMVNMSEDWREDIIEDIRGAITYNPNTRIGRIKRRIKGPTPEKREARTRAYQGNRSDAAERYGASQRNPYDDNRGDIPSLRGR